jgi:hypothetical protein
MPKFRKKPVVIEAVQFTEAMAKGDADLPEGVRMKRRSVGAPPRRELVEHRHVIETLEGTMEVAIGDWVITGVAGEKYPCKDSIFVATYDAVEEQE